jgi:tRNA A37 threonylcarbamoyladenosine dehydratase
MSPDDYDTRFAGIQRVYGTEQLAQMREMHICIIGIGGVGSWAVEALARNGIGALTIIDHDQICATNTNRQIHTLTQTLGRSKVEVMTERLLQINPNCRCEPIDDFITMDTIDRYLVRAFDCVIDAIDSIKFKAAVIHHCKRNKIPIIATGGAGGLTDPTMIKVADLNKTYNDPLAAKVRSRLRKDYGFSTNPKRSFGVECVFSSQQPVYPREDGTVSHEKPGIHGVSLDCRFGYGATSLVTAPFGFVAAARAVRRVLRRQALPADARAKE